MTEKEAQEKFGNYIKDAAFPQTVETDEKIFHTKGLTKREYFAAMAMIGLLANKFSPGSDNNVWAVEIADRLMEKLNESQP